MDSELFFDKKKYISTKESSKISGYSTDYIGQLCRLKKIECKRVSNSWFIEIDSLENYIKLNGKPSKASKILNRKKLDKNDFSKEITSDVSKNLHFAYRHYPHILNSLYKNLNKNGVSFLPIF